MSESRSHGARVSSSEQQHVYELMRERLYELVGPGGSFRITLGRATADEAVFASTVADTIAWAVAAAVEGKILSDGPRHESSTPQAEHEALWSHVESELLIRRTGPGGFFDTLGSERPAEVDAATLDAIRAA